MSNLKLERGWSDRQFAELTEVSPHTAGRVFRGERVQYEIAARMFDNLGLDLRAYVESDDDAGVLAEWKVETVPSEFLELSNGLQFGIFKLRHSVLPNTWARGKCYDLREARTKDQKRIQAQLQRHPTVCRRVAPHPQFPRNERVVRSEDGWRFWVIDHWFDGWRLDEKLRYVPLPNDLLKKVMHQILDGLEILHAKEIVRRELCPKYLVLSEPNADVLFTELELSKLLDGVISVSNDWQVDPYRAPEVAAFDVHPSVDLYSWAQILIHAATGKVPPTPANPDILEQTPLPDAVQKIARRCLAPSHTFRPRTVAEVRNKIADWK